MIESKLVVFKILTSIICLNLQDRNRKIAFLFFTNDMIYSLGGEIMGCLKFYNDEYTRIKQKMENNKDNQTEMNTSKESSFSKEQVEQLKKIIEDTQKPSPKKNIGEVLGIIVSCIAILTSVLTSVYNIYFGYFTLKDNIEDLQGEVKELVAVSSEMYEYLYEDEGVKDQLGDINKILSSEAKVINADEDIIYTLAQVSNKLNVTNLTTASFVADEPIGTDENGNICLAKDLINTTILVTYEDNDKEVYFLGQYNENYHWNGECVINAYYPDGKLFGICESEFNDGTRLNYKSFTITDKDENEWTLSERICGRSEDGMEESNIGTSIAYTLDYNKEKNFTNTNVRKNDILYVDDFLNTVDIEMSRYYYGSTSNGSYNDTTGDAYLIIYDNINNDSNELYLRTLYVGNFVDGKLSDKTGNAWEIVYSDDYKKYLYQKGTFENNSFVKGISKPIGIEQIEEIIADYEFNFELKWKTDEKQGN